MKKMLLLALMLSLNSCVTMIRGTSHKCRITSTPPGANVSFGGCGGVTPVTLDVPRSRHKRGISCSMPGYKHLQAVVRPRKLRDGDIPWLIFPTIIDAVLVVPFLVDDFFVAAFRDYPIEIHIVLEPRNSPHESGIHMNYPFEEIEGKVINVFHPEQ